MRLLIILHGLLKCCMYIIILNIPKYLRVYRKNILYYNNIIYICISTYYTIKVSARTCTYVFEIHAVEIT